MNTYRILIRAVCAAAILCQILSCSLASILERRPTLDLEGGRISDFSMEFVELELKLRLNNPYPLKLPAGALGGELSFEGRPITSITTTTPDVAANDGSSFPLKLRVPFKTLLDMGGLVEGKEIFAFRARGNAEVRLESGLAGMPARFTVPFDYTQEVPAVIPEVSVSNVQFEAPSLASPKAGVTLDLGLRNRARGKFSLGDLSYALVLGQQNVLSGQTSAVENLGNESRLTIKSDLPLLSVPLALLQNNRSVKLQVKSSASFPGFADSRAFPIEFEKNLYDSK
jgi:hypothetical protein